VSAWPSSETMAATMAGGSRKLKYEKMLEKKRHQRELEEKQVDDWMNKYDTDGNGMIEKNEFEKLIQGVYGGQGVAIEPDVITSLFKKCTEGTENPNSIPRIKVRETVVKYKESLVHHEYLNALMDQFDTNKDGNLDRDEIKRMLQIILRDGAKLQLNSKGREYKLSSLENLYNKGILDKNSYMQKLHKAQGGGDDVVKYSEVSDEDVDFILKEADADGNGVLDRDEVLASLALWTRLMKMAEPEEPASGFSQLCSIM
jgi:Ca2+-binding EF-hand superfamily protein